MRKYIFRLIRTYKNNTHNRKNNKFSYKSYLNNYLGEENLNNTNSNSSSNKNRIFKFSNNNSIGENIVKNIVCSGSSSNVIMTVVAGRVLFYKGEYDLGFDPEEIIYRCGIRTRRIINGV